MGVLYVLATLYILEEQTRFDIGEMALQCVEKFCYVGDVVSAARFTEFEVAGCVSLLVLREHPLWLRERIYAICVGRVMLYSTETCSMRKEEEVKRYILCKEARVVMWM